MYQALIDILAPVVGVLAIGYVAARYGLIDGRATKALSDVTFSLMAPALLFRAMATSDFRSLTLATPLVYFGAAVPLFIALSVWRAARGKGAASAAVFALSATYSNAVMLGIPLIRLAFGEAGFSLLLTIIALHSLILVTSATIVLEVGRARGSAEHDGRSSLMALGVAVRAALLHPVILPILAGLVWSLAGLPLPRVADRTLEVLGSAAPSLCLILLGASLAHFGLRAGLADALRLTALKSFVFPALVWMLGHWVLHTDPLPLAVATITAALPIGNNVYLFAQRYEVEREPVSAGVLLSTLACAISLPVLLVLFAV